MTGNVHLVFSNPPNSVGDEQYNEWYNYHLTEILAVPGFRTARRYGVTTHLGTRAPAGYRFLSLYEIDVDAEQIRRNLSGRSASRMRLPTWFSGIQFASWTCLLRESYGIPRPADYLQFVFSSVPDDACDTTYDTRARQHMERSLARSGVGRGWRFRTVAANAAAKSAATATDLEIYELSAPGQHAWEPPVDANEAEASRPARRAVHAEAVSLLAVALGKHLARSMC
jgi:hypothetical protein